MYILNYIYIWIFGLEHIVKPKAVVMQINSPRNLVQHMHAYKDRGCFMEFGNLYLY